MKFEIPIDREITIAQYNLQLNLTFKKNLTKSSLNVLGAGVIIYLGWLDIGDKRSPGYVFLSIGLFVLFNALNFFWYYVKTSRKLKKLYRDAVLLREKHKDISTWRFDPDVFGYKDMWYDYSIKWEAFKGYKVMEKNLFLQLAESIDKSFMIGEIEIGQQAFADVITFLEGKLSHLGE